MKGLLSQLENTLGSLSDNSDTEFNGISIDSRNIKKGNLFIAIKGKNFDGHDYIDNAFKNGASSLITERKFKNVPQIIVKNTEISLGQIASYYLNLIGPLSVGITGTNGKTSVTSLIGSMLNEYKPTITSHGNYNNQIGLPLSIFKLKNHHKFCVLEMGASKIGDINYLVNITLPKIVTLLNVSPAHLDSFKTINNILTSKEEIFLNQSYKKIVVLNKDDKYFSRWEKICEQHILKTISQSQTADYYISNKRDDIVTISTSKNETFDLDVKDQQKHLLDNILISIACSMEAGASSQHIINGYKNRIDVNGRFSVKKGINGSTIIDSSYNANPASFESSINSLISMNGRPWIILGDMGELGDKSEQYHCQIAKYAKEKGIEKIFITGKYQSSIANVFGKNAFSFETKPELIAFILPIIKDDVNILIKASRFMRFETIVDALTKIKY